MPAIKFPQSDNKRLVLLDSIVRRATSEAGAGRGVLPADLMTRVSAQLADFTPLVEEAIRLKAEKKRANNNKKEAVATLSRYVRAFRLGVLNRQKMDLLDNDYPLYFGINDSIGYISADKWLHVAQKYINGEEAAVARGFSPMCNPSATQLQDKLDSASHAVTMANTAALALDHHQHQTDHLRPETDRLIRMVNTYLTMLLHEQAPDDLRRIKRRYGFRYDIAPTNEPD